MDGLQGCLWELPVRRPRSRILDLGHQCLEVRGGTWAVQPPIGQRLLMPTDAIQVARHWRFSADRSRLTVLH